MKLKIVIYHGIKGSGKTMQLTSRLASLFPGGFESAKNLLTKRLVLKTDTDHILCYDDCDLKNDLININTTGIDWLYISTEKLPKYYRKLIWNYFGEEVYDVRECMFPLCHYIFKYNKKYYAEMGGIQFLDYSRKKVIDRISRVPDTKEISIPDINGMRVFLENNKIVPTNFIEWGLDYALLMQFYDKFNKMTDDKILVTEFEACAIANYNGGEIDWIEDLFFDLFADLPF
jgi:hypothetical protein